MDERSALAAIGRLCDEQDVGWFEFIRVGSATTHIAYVQESGSVYLPEGLDADEFLMAAAAGKAHRLVRADEVRALLAEVVPVPQPGIDEQGLHDVLWVLRPFGADEHWIENAKRAILALVRPVEGVVLTPGSEDARLAAWALNHAAEEWSMNGNDAEAEKRWDLAARLEGADS